METKPQEKTPKKTWPERRKELRQIWRISKEALSGNGWLFLGANAANLLSVVIAFMNPMVIRMTVDSVIGDKPFSVPGWMLDAVGMLGGRTVLQQNLWIAGLALVGLTVVNGVFMFFRGKWSSMASERIAQTMRNKLYSHLQAMSYAYHVKAETGDLIQRCTSDVETIRGFLATQFVEVGRIIFMLAYALGLMLAMNVKLAFACVALVPVIVAYSIIFFTQVRKQFKKADEAEGKMSTVLQENLTGVRVVRAFGREAYEVDRFESRSATYRDHVYNLVKILSWFWGMGDFLTITQTGIALILGAYMAGTGQITLGTMMAFITYVGMMVWPIRQLGRILADMGKSFVSFGRIGQILDEPIEGADEKGSILPIRGDIVFDHVSFHYEEGREILQDVSFTVKEGQTVAILGGTGSGKSTLVHLLQRLFDYTEGSITIGGMEVKGIDRKWLRKHVGIVLQEPFLYSRTIRDNIMIAHKDASEDNIMESARIASVHDVITSFDKGYDTMVGERGVTLSGGQKQRVAIARMLIRHCPILIFDDSLSAVDTETDMRIRRALTERRKGCTTFIISHRVSTISEADLILVLEEGRLTEAGTHQELIAQPGLYQRVWGIQNALEDELDDPAGAEPIAQGGDAR